METDKKSHVMEGRTKTRRKPLLIGASVVTVIVVFIAGIALGKQLKTNEIRDRIVSSVGSNTSDIKPYELTLLGEKLQYTDNQETNAGIDRDFLSKLDEKKLMSGKPDDLIVLYVKASDLDVAKAKELIAQVITQRAKELSAQQKQQLQGSGLQL